MEMKAMLAERVQEWTRQWEQQGIEKGRQEGRQEGQAELLVKILERQFGPLPPVYQQRILTAGPEDIWRWVERALSAAALEQVFD
jgi:predicted transposase YdaD